MMLHGARTLLSLMAIVLAGSIIFGCSGGGAEPQNSAQEDFLPPAAEGEQWELVWSDEFEADQLDRSLWQTPVGVRRDGYWAAEDTYLDGEGNLVLRTRKSDGKYYSGAVRTMGVFEHRFGYWETRCMFHTEVGHWPAFWLFSSPGVGIVGDGGRDGTEIDIMEKPWPDEDKINVALHWDGYGEHHDSEGKQVIFPGVSWGWHTFGLLWTPDEYVFYIDGQEIWRTSAGGVSQVQAYVKLTDEVGDWGGDIATARLPDYTLFDYVRVFDYAGGGMGKSVP